MRVVIEKQVGNKSEVLSFLAEVVRKVNEGYTRGEGWDLEGTDPSEPRKIEVKSAQTGEGGSQGSSGGDQAPESV
jgi:hypothetical protein